MKQSIKAHLTSIVVSILFAAVMVAFWMGYFPRSVTVNGFEFMTSDTFIIIGAGILGYQYGIFMYLAIVVWMLCLFGQQAMSGMFSFSLYLLLALVSGVAGWRDWYRRKRTALFAFFLQEGISVGGVYLVLVLILRASDMTLFQTILAVMPENLISVAVLCLYYRYVPDGIKGSFGADYLRTSYRGQMAGLLRERRAGRLITTLSMLEGTVVGILSVFVSESIIGIRGELVPNRQLAAVYVYLIHFLLMICFSIPLAVMVNEVILQIVVRVLGEQQRLSMQLELAEAKSEAKSMFLSNMSHEIRTPINAVLGMDEMILRESREEQTLEYAENIRMAGNTLLGLVNDVLDFSKIEAGKMDIIPVKYELSSVLHDLVTMISVRAENKGLAFITDVAKDIPSVLFGDEIRLKQIITNILTNAVKYTEQGSVTLAVSAEKKDEEHIELFVSVKDTGIGIKEEDLKKLSSAFERIEEERNRNVEGTGLGMNITTRLLDMMGSSLSVSSVYGKGSDFSFRLTQKVVSWERIGDFEAAWKESVKTRQGYQTAFQAPEGKILAVDDTPMNLLVLAGLLRHTKLQVDTAECGMECLEKLTRETYDMVFLDHRMPEMDGIETLQRMKELAGNRNQNIPVIALTANAAAGAKEEYLSYGFTDYLTKPINSALLEELVLTYLPEDKISRIKTEEPTAERNQEAGEDAEKKLESKLEPKLESKLESKLEPETDLPVIDGIDWDYAKLHLPRQELLEMAVADFYRCIDLHANRLEEMYDRLPDGQAFGDYRIQVHGMKSSAATIGIVPLAGMAKELENASAAMQEDTVKSLHGWFLQSWKGYKALLNDTFHFEPGPEEKKAYDRNEAERLLEDIRKAMEDFDIDRADEAVKELDSFAFPDRMKQGIEKLKSAVAVVDDEASMEAVSSLLELLDGE